MRYPSASAVAFAEPVAPARAVTMAATLCVQPFRFDPHWTVEVPVVRWPDDTGARERYARVGAPCLLVVGAAARAPVRWTELEDWVRETAPQTEFVARAVTVARRADRCQRPRLDRPRAVSFRGRTVVVPESHARLVALLVERFGATVADDEIRSLCDDGGISTHSEAVKTSLRRLKDALAPLGLRLTRVRAAGYLLDRAE
jgi:hypothetical protein